MSDINRTVSNVSDSLPPQIDKNIQQRINAILASLPFFRINSCKLGAFLALKFLSVKIHSYYFG
jgi:outer membrane scaffolding protein for murein synthesis (MipA/OmpV family)